MMPQKLTMPEMMAWRMPPMPEITAMMQLPIVRNMLWICRMYVRSLVVCSMIAGSW